VLTLGRGSGADIQWNIAAGELDPTPLEGLDAVVHLAGAPIARRWTPKSKKEIRRSRVMGTTLLARAILSLNKRPAVLVSSSAVGFYGDRADEILSERSGPGTGFLAEVCRAWEGATDPASEAGVRVVHLRTGVVLSPDGGALAKLLLPFRLGLGGPVGNGRQWMSWIGLTDMVRSIRHAVAGEVRGPVNAVAPNPVTNAEFARELGRALGRPAFFRLPAVALELVFGKMARETLLASQRAHPARLQETGFVFDEPFLAGALTRELQGWLTR